MGDNKGTTVSSAALQAKPAEVKDVDSAVQKPSGVSLTSWQKFQMLKKQRREMTAQSSGKQVEKIRSDVMSNVRASFSLESDRKLLKERGVDIDAIVEGKESKDTGCSSQDAQSQRVNEESPKETAEAEAGPSSWSDVKPFMGAHDHLKGVDRGKHAPKTELEERIDAAVAAGDYELAEKLSDHLSNREFGKRIADAFDAARFTEKRKREEELKNAKKKKKLAWGFEHKERWEMKGNM